METDSMKLLLLCLMFVILIFYVIRFGGGRWTELAKKCNIFWFIVNVLLFIGFIIGTISPPQPMVYMIACFVQGFYVIAGVIILAIVAFILGRMAASSNESAPHIAAKINIVGGVLGLLEVFSCGLIAYFSFKVWELGG